MTRNVTGTMSRSYAEFVAMIATSSVAMFALMYFNTYELDHLYWSETRFYAALYMGAAMAVIIVGLHASHVPRHAAQHRHLRRQRRSVRHCLIPPEPRPRWTTSPI